eukprot:TRINITY_DN2702_c0_g2_i4.p1 TRINITY_DN2702_c0_g2~~TRINITY_DN2702_c0_g2_i4.p1  ORF type:complete len:1075 (+),score=269.35 TRINITY_DN2702_c0_g2_i4:97-3321(+)
MEASVLNKYFDDNEEVTSIGVPEALSDFELSKDVLSDTYLTEGQIPSVEEIGHVLIGFSAFIVEEGSFIAMGVVVVGELGTARYNYRNGLVEMIPNSTIDTCSYYPDLQVVVIHHSGDEFLFLPHVILDSSEGYYFSSETSDKVTEKLSQAIPTFTKSGTHFTHDDVYEEIQRASSIHNRCVHVMSRVGVSDSEMSGSPRSLPSDGFLSHHKKNGYQMFDEIGANSYLTNYRINGLPQSPVSEGSDLSMGEKKKTTPCNPRMSVSPIQLMDSESNSAPPSPDSWSRRSSHQRNTWEMRTANAIQLLKNTEKYHSYKLATAAQWIESLDSVQEVSIIVTQYDVHCCTPSGEVLWKDRIADYNKIIKFTRHPELLKLSSGGRNKERLLLLLNFEPQLRSLERILSDARPMQVVTVSDEQLRKMPERDVIESLCDTLEVMLFSQRDRAVSFAPPQYVVGGDDDDGGHIAGGSSKKYMKEKRPPSAPSDAGVEVISSESDVEETGQEPEHWPKRKRLASSLASLIKPPSFVSITSRETSLNSEDLPNIGMHIGNAAALASAAVSSMADVKAALEREEQQDNTLRTELDDSTLSVLICCGDDEGDGDKLALEKIISEHYLMGDKSPTATNELNKQFECLVAECCETESRTAIANEQFEEAVEILAAFASQSGRMFAAAVNRVEAPSLSPSSFSGSPLAEMSPGDVVVDDDVDEINTPPATKLVDAGTTTTPVTEHICPPPSTPAVTVNRGTSPVAFPQEEVTARGCSPIQQLKHQFPSVKGIGRGSSPIAISSAPFPEKSPTTRSIGVIASTTNHHLGTQTIAEERYEATATETSSVATQVAIKDDTEPLIGTLKASNSLLVSLIDQLFYWSSSMMFSSRQYFDDFVDCIVSSTFSVAVEVKEQLVLLQSANRAVDDSVTDEDCHHEENVDDVDDDDDDDDDNDSDDHITLDNRISASGLSSLSPGGDLNSERLRELRLARERLEEDIASERIRQNSIQDDVAPRDLEGHIPTEPSPSTTKKLTLERTLNDMRQRRREIEKRLTANNIFIDISAKELTEANEAPMTSPEPIVPYHYQAK